MAVMVVMAVASVMVGDGSGGDGSEGGGCEPTGHLASIVC
jgi:hypothetical protein